MAVSFPMRLKNGMLHLSVYVIKRDINLFRLYSEVFILLSDFLERRFIKKECLLIIRDRIFDMYVFRLSILSCQ